MQTISFANIEELKTVVGQEVGISDWVKIEQSQIQAFADVTNDQQWIHTDVSRSQKESPYGTTVAHGYFTLSLVPSFIHSCITYPFVTTSINYGLNKVRFPNAVRVNSSLRARFTLVKVDTIDGGVQVEWSIVIEIQGQDKPACAAEMLARLYF